MRHSKHFRIHTGIPFTHTDACTSPSVLSLFISRHLSPSLSSSPSISLHLSPFLSLIVSHRPTFNGSHRSGIGLIEGVRPPATGDLSLPVFRPVHPRLKRQLIVPLKIKSWKGWEKDIRKKFLGINRDQYSYYSSHICLYKIGLFVLSHVHSDGRVVDDGAEFSVQFL